MRQEQAELRLYGPFVRAVLSQSGFPHFALLLRAGAETVTVARLLKDHIRVYILMIDAICVAYSVSTLVEVASVVVIDVEETSVVKLVASVVVRVLVALKISVKVASVSVVDTTTEV